MPRPAPIPPPPGDHRAGVWRWIAAAVIVVAGFWPYLATLDAPFVFDDIPGIAQNESIRDLSDLGRVLHPPTEGAGMDSRPIINLSLALNHALGGLNPWGYRFTNIGIHVLGALTLFGLMRRTLALPTLPAPLRTQALPVAFVTALLWTVHPLQSETVICIIQRTESLVSLWYLLVLYGFVRAVEPGGSRRWFPAAWTACLIGMASKEVMVSAPLLVFLFDRTFVAGTFRAAWQARAPWYASLAATWLLLAWLVIDSGGSRGGTAGFDQGVSAWTYLLTQARALTIYLKLSLWPHPLIVDYGDWLAPGFHAVRGEFLLISGLLGATVFALVRHPRCGFLGAGFFAILAPSSSVYPLVSQTIAEHRMHLPLAAVLAFLVLALFRLPLRAAVASGVALALAAALVTARRGADYESDLALWTDVVAKTPANPWGHFNLAAVHFRAGRFAEAEQENRAVIALQPGHADGHLALALTLERLGRATEAESHYRASLNLKPETPEAHFRLGLILLRQGRSADAIPHFAETVRLRPDHADAEGNWGAALFQTGRMTEAVPRFERVLQLRPDSIEARYNLALLLLQLGRPDAALPHLETAARLAPRDAGILNTWSEALARTGRHEEATRVRSQIAALNP